VDATAAGTLQLLAEVAFEAGLTVGLTERVVSHEAIRQAILEMGHSWQRAKDWIQSPDPQYALKRNMRSKNSETA